VVLAPQDIPGDRIQLAQSLKFTYFRVIGGSIQQLTQDEHPQTG
jgi:hypothetical protein